MNQLAAAYEQGVIGRGSHVHLGVESQGEGPHIRLQVAKGVAKNQPLRTLVAF